MMEEEVKIEIVGTVPRTRSQSRMKTTFKVKPFPFEEVLVVDIIGTAPYWPYRISENLLGILEGG